MRGQENSNNKKKGEQVSTPQPRYWFPWLRKEKGGQDTLAYHGRGVKGKNTYHSSLHMLFNGEPAFLVGIDDGSVQSLVQ